MRSILLSLILLFNFALAENTAPDNAVYAFNTEAQSARFNDLISQFRCLVCQNESLADSNAGLASDLRQQIYLRVQQGQSDADIRHYLIARYGDYVLFKPPFTLNTSALWILPFLSVLAGLIFLCIKIQKRSRI